MGSLVTRYTGVEGPAEDSTGQSARKEGIRTLLKGIETGDEASIAIVNADKYIQHNPQTEEGGEGLAELFKRLADTSPRVNVVRIFEDGDFVFAHTEYDFDTDRVGFEIFRFEDDLAVEHWDNIQPAQGPNASGHSMVDGPTEVSDQDSTESNREKVREFVDTVLIGGQPELLGKYIDTVRFVEHNPRFGDDMTALNSALARDDGDLQYQRSHRILAEGDFVLAVSEGTVDGTHSAFYDLFRLAEGRIVEHWDTTEAIPPREQWKNDNGKF